MSYGLSVLVSDIPANKEINLHPDRYFACGNISELQEKILMHLHKNLSKEERVEMEISLREKYNWDTIADKTIAIYRQVTRLPA
jgi:glycosyltransferase involved in cell wall biosynthesis